MKSLIAVDFISSVLLCLYNLLNDLHLWFKCQGHTLVWLGIGSVVSVSVMVGFSIYLAKRSSAAFLKFLLK